MSFALASLIVYTVGIKCHGIDPTVEYAPEHIFSLSENTANKLLKESMADLVQHNQTHLVRIYPKGTRVNSTNYAPHRYWAAGAQVVAINWQTFGECRCGGILRPILETIPGRPRLHDQPIDVPAEWTLRVCAKAERAKRAQQGRTFQTYEPLLGRHSETSRSRSLFWCLIPLHRSFRRSNCPAPGTKMAKRSSRSPWSTP